MRQERFDLAMLLTNSFPLGADGLVGRGKAADRICPIRPRAIAHAQTLSPPLSGRIVPEPTVETYLAIADALGCGNESSRLELATTAAEEQSADAVFRRLGLRRDGRLILLNSSGAYGAAKLWPVEYFGRLARRVATQVRSRRAGDVRSQRAGNRKRDRKTIRQSPRLFHGRPASGSGHGQGLHSPRAIDGFHRQRPAARRRGPGKAGDHALRADAACLERKSHAAGNQPGARFGLHRLSQANMSLGPSSLHARTDRGYGLCRGVKDVGKLPARPLESQYIGTLHDFDFRRRAFRAAFPAFIGRPNILGSGQETIASA